MLKVLRGQSGNFNAPCALLLGGFDGLHSGHGSLLDAAKKTGLPVGLTTISGGKEGSDIFTFAEREIIFGRAGFSFVWEIEFTEQFKNITAENFLRGLFEKIPAKALFCGEDFRFGKDADGTPELLKKLAPCPVSVLPLKKSDGKKISASRLKGLAAEGKIAELNALLIGGYFIGGVVEHGREVGRKLGFPTANISFGKRKLLLADGVYGGFVEINAGRFPTIINIGARPTFGVAEKKVEAYLKGYSGDLYGTEVRIFPTEFLRPVQKFSSEEELKEQLRKDIQRI